jgi:hypothetical protein
MQSVLLPLVLGSLALSQAFVVRKLPDEVEAGSLQKSHSHFHVFHPIEEHGSALTAVKSGNITSHLKLDPALENNIAASIRRVQ